MPTELETLLDLQDKDRVVIELQEELDALKPEEEELDGALAQVEGELAEANAELESAAALRKELETKIEGYRLMQERKRAKLEFVRGAKEASALMAELDLARSVMAQEEADWLKSADRVEAADVRVSEARAALEAITAEQAPARSALKEKRDECEKKIAKAEAVRDSARDPIDRELLTRYERVRQGNARFSLYRLHGEACGHCFTHVPKHIQQQLKNRSQIGTCQVCGVMLFVADE